MGRIKSLVLFLCIAFAVQAIASYFTASGLSNWYPNLHKPIWTPPDWVFGPVWTVLYLMIAVAGWRIYSTKPTPMRRLALSFYIAQFAFNLLWCFIFFYLENILLGLLDIILLAMFILLTILSSWKENRLSSILLIPYLLWVIYAMSLNIGICIVNE